MKIVSLIIQNLKKIKAVRVDTDDKGNLIVITGNNGNGKSTVLDSISYAMGGEKLCPEKPIREGEDKAKVVIVTEKYTITRRWWINPDNPKKVKSSLEIKDSDGTKLKSGQTVLNSFIKEKMIDVLEFAKFSPKKQVEILKEITGLDFTELDKERDKIYSERTILNREIKNIQARIAAIEIPNVPLEETPLKELYEEKQAILIHNSELDKMSSEIGNLTFNIKNTEKNIMEIESQISELEKRKQVLIDKKEEMKNKLNEKELEVKSFEKRSFSDIETRINNATKCQEVLIQKRRLEELDSSLDETKKKTEQISERILDIDEEKSSMLKRCKMPIDGLSFDNNGLFFNGLPFSQLSSAEEISVCASICMKYNPNFKVLYTKYASLMDQSHLNILKEKCEENDFQLWIEKVSEDPEPNSVHIVDGEVEE